MKPLNTNIGLLFTLIVLILDSCSAVQPNVSNDLEKAFEETISITDINSHLRLKIISNERKFGANIRILVENIGDTPIYFSENPETPFIKIFILQNDGWVEMENHATYFCITGDDSCVLSPVSVDYPHSFTTWIKPAVKYFEVDNGKQEIVRVFVSGELMVNGEKSGYQVGAYTDMFINP